MPNIEQDIGMEAHKSPSVFNFYQHDYSPSGALSDAGLYAPEAGLAIAPHLIGLLNGLTALVQDGLSSCNKGFGLACADEQLRVNFPSANWSDGRLEYRPQDESASAVVSELDLLLTAGRLNPNATEVIMQAYQSSYDKDGATAALRMAQQLFLATPEFRATNLHVLTGLDRPPATQSTTPLPQPHRFKAVVVLFMNGGCDSFNLLMPSGGCAAKDMFEEYTEVRGDVAIGREGMVNISSPPGSQPCDTFGVHKSLDFLAELYEQGEAAFAANIGNLVEPVTRESYEDGSAKLPRQPFAHNFAVKAAKTCAVKAASKGVLGRMLDAMSEQAFSTSAFSVAGDATMIEAESVAPDMIDRKVGAIRFEPAIQSGDGLCELCEHMDAVLRPKSKSAFGDTIASLTASSLDRSEKIGAALEFALNSTFATDKISQQLEQVAKLINVSAHLRTERGAYYVSLGGFDTHSDNGPQLEKLFGEINAALRAFVNEIKSQGRWDDVLVVSVSDFGRTITSNGLGTDHGWGGNHFVLGGSVNGGKIHGSYPDDLTTESPLNSGRGRLIPTTPWESLWRPVSEWFGVEPAQMNTVLPNLDNFDEDAIIRTEALFNMAKAPPSPPSSPAVQPLPAVPTPPAPPPPLPPPPYPPPYPHPPPSSPSPPHLPPPPECVEMSSSSAPVAIQGSDDTSEWMNLYAVTGRSDDQMVTSVKVCASVSFSGGIQNIKLRLRGYLDSTSTTKPLHSPSLSGATVTQLTNACFSDGAHDTFPTLSSQRTRCYI